MFFTPVSLKSIGLILLICTVFLGSTLLHASTGARYKTAKLNISGELTQFNLASKLEFIEDELDLLTLEQVENNYHDYNWQFSNSDIPNFGFTQSTFWMHVKVANLNSSNSDWILQAPYSQINELDVHLTFSDGTRATQEHGINRLNKREFPAHRHILIPLKLAKGESVEIYFRYRNDLSSQMPLILWDEDTFFYEDELNLATQVLFFGIMSGMIIYNFFLFLFVRDRAYAHYVCFVLSITIFQAFQQGFTYQFLTFLSEDAYLRATTLSIVFAIFFANNFFNEFLNLKENHKLSHQYLEYVRAACVFVFFSSFVLDNFYALQLAVFLSAPGVFGVIALSVVALINRIKAARYFVAAWSTFLLGVVLLMLNKMGIIPRNFITENGMQIGSAIEVLLLSIALADRINQERQEKIKAQERALKNEKITRETQEKAKAELELRVNERTEELSKAMERLEVANQTLKEISNIDGLTGVKNRRYFNDRLREEWNRAIRSNSEVSLLLIDLDHFKRLNDNYGHLFGDECLIAAAMIIRSHARREEDLAARYGGEEFAVILPNCPYHSALDLAECIRSDIEKLPIPHNDTVVRISASIGVASLTPEQSQSTPDQLISAADIALYDAKRSGRNQVSLFKPQDNLH